MNKGYWQLRQEILGLDRNDDAAKWIAANESRIKFQRFIKEKKKRKSRAKSRAKIIEKILKNREYIDGQKAIMGIK